MSEVKMMHGNDTKSRASVAAPSFVKIVDETEERAVFIEADEGWLTGFLTRPLGQARGIGVIMLAGGLWQLSINQNRFGVRLARALAAQGFHVLRFDLHGSGESEGVVGRYALDEPFTADLAAAVRWAGETQELRRFVLVGSCFGGRTCLSLVEQIPDLVGLALFSTPLEDSDLSLPLVRRSAKMPVRRVAGKAFDLNVIRNLRYKDRRSRYRLILAAKLKALFRKRPPEVYTSPLFMKPIVATVQRKIPTLLAYGEERMSRQFHQEMEGKLGSLIRKHEDTVEVHTFDRMLHGLPTLEAQAIVTDMLLGWFSRTFDGRAESKVTEQTGIQRSAADAGRSDHSERRTSDGR